MSAGSFRNPDPSEDAIRTPLLGSPSSGDGEQEEASMPTKTSLIAKNLAGNGRTIFTQVSPTGSESNDGATADLVP